MVVVFGGFYLGSGGFAFRVCDLGFCVLRVVLVWLVDCVVLWIVFGGVLFYVVVFWCVWVWWFVWVSGLLILLVYSLLCVGFGVLVV